MDTPIPILFSRITVNVNAPEDAINDQYSDVEGEYYLFLEELEKLTDSYKSSAYISIEVEGD